MLQLLEKNSEHVELRPRPLFSEQSSNFGHHYAPAVDHFNISVPPDPCCPQLPNLISKPEIARPIWDLEPQPANSVPTRPMLSPITELSLQTGNRTPHFAIAGANGRFSPHRTNVVPDCETESPTRNRAPHFGICRHKRPISCFFTIFVGQAENSVPLSRMLPRIHVCSTAFVILVLKRQNGFPNRQLFCANPRGRPQMPIGMPKRHILSTK